MGMPRRQAKYRDHFAMEALMDRDTAGGVERMRDHPDWVNSRVAHEGLRGSTCLHLLMGQQRPRGYEPEEWIDTLRELTKQVGSSQPEPSASFLRCLGKVFCGRTDF